MRGAVSALLLLTLSCSAPKASNAEPFAVEGRPLHPSAVYLLLTRLSDLRPIAAAVDVRGCEESDERCAGSVSRRRGGGRYEHPDVLGEGYFAYRFVGTTSRGVHVLETALSGGGSGIFCDVLFVHLRRQPYVDHDKVENRWTLSSLGEIVLGDRSGKKVSLDDDILLIRSPDGTEQRIAVPEPK